MEDIKTLMAEVKEALSEIKTSIPRKEVTSLKESIKEVKAELKSLETSVRELKQDPLVEQYTSLSTKEVRDSFDWESFLLCSECVVSLSVMCAKVKNSTIVKLLIYTVPDRCINLMLITQTLLTFRAVKGPDGVPKLIFMQEDNNSGAMYYIQMSMSEMAEINDDLFDDNSEYEMVKTTRGFSECHNDNTFRIEYYTHESKYLPEYLKARITTWEKENLRKIVVDTPFIAITPLKDYSMAPLLSNVGKNIPKDRLVMKELTELLYTVEDYCRNKVRKQICTPGQGHDYPEEMLGECKDFNFEVFNDATCDGESDEEFPPDIEEDSNY